MIVMPVDVNITAGLAAMQARAALTSPVRRAH
jgi:hypothetical protein